MINKKEITIYDIAEALSLSPSTVSRGLNGDRRVKEATSAKIKAMADSMGYRHNKFASNLRCNRTNTIGVIVPRLNSHFMATAISGIERITSEKGYGLIISQSQELWDKEVACTSTMFSSRVDGLIVSLSYETGNPSHFDIFLDKSIPVVFFDRIAHYRGCTCVVIDNYKAGYDVTSHLIEQGCRRVMHLGGNMLRNVYRERLRGYKAALLDHGLSFDERLVSTGELTTQYGIELAGRILSMDNPPDALFTANDTTAVAIMVELMREGVRIPEDIAVAGFNNEPASSIISPNLTTVEYPALRMGECATSLLIDKLNDAKGKPPKQLVLEHQLLIRDSSVKKR